ncbi:unnamed protein product [Amoebophrya sp. A25]|nr:unnamed protein product [Amoebophrya sp. A25]|eukprot:GSA25T00023578001.1
MSQAEVCPFNDNDILQSLRVKLKGACYKQTRGAHVDIRSFFPGGGKEEMGTLTDLKTVVRQHLKLTPQFVPDPSLAKLAAYLASPLAVMAPTSPRSPREEPAGQQQVGGSSSSTAAAPPPAAAASSQAAEGNSTLAQIRANPIIGEMLNLPLLPSELPGSGTSTSNSMVRFPLSELQKFVKHGAPTVSEKAEVGRVVERKKAERCVRKFQVSIHMKVMESYAPGAVTNIVNTDQHASTTDHAVYVRHQFEHLLRHATGGQPTISLHAFKKFLRDKLKFMNWDFGEADCTTLWSALYAFPDLNLLEQCAIASDMAQTGNFAVVTSTPSEPRRQDYPFKEAPKLSPRQRRTQKLLYPSTDSQFVFQVYDLVRLLDLPKKSGLSIEFPDFRMSNGSEANTYALEDSTAPEKLQDKYRKWCMARNRLSANFSSSGRTNPPRTRLHSNTIQHEQWRLNHTLGY